MPPRRRAFGSLLAAVSLACVCAAHAQGGEEVPFITTPDNVTLQMLRLAQVGPRDYVVDLGSGDGRIVITAARRFGATGLGVEIVPDLVKQSLRSARDAGVANKVSFMEQDLFKTDLSAATVVTMYLLPEVNLQLRPRLLQLKPGTRIVSHDWDMGDWQPDQTLTVPAPGKKVGVEKASKLHLWVVPARIEGLWCGNGPLRDFSLQLKQRYQEFDGALTRNKRVRPVAGRIEGATVRTQAVRNGSLVLDASDGELRITGGSGPLALARGGSFRRSGNGSC